MYTKQCHKAINFNSLDFGPMVVKGTAHGTQPYMRGCPNAVARDFLMATPLPETYKFDYYTGILFDANRLMASAK
jgi:hypothetical protein